MSKRMKYLWGLIGSWALVIIATVIFYFDLWDAFYFFTSLWIVGCGLGGVVIGCITLLAIFKEGSKVLPALALLVVIGLVLLLIKGPGSRWGALARFYLSKPSYERTLAKVRAAREKDEKQKVCAGKCEIDIDQETGAAHERVVFPWTRDDVMLGWIGVVYDPAGEVARAQKNRGSFFGCMFLKAERLSGDWYLCHFWHR
jgi:hypothetical protein